MEDTTVSAAAQLLATLQRICGASTGAPIACESWVERGDLIVRTSAHDLPELLRLCKGSPELDFSMLVDLTAVDWMDAKPKRFEVVYQLLSISKKHRLTILVELTEDAPEIPSATGFWQGASFLEREVWDMFGIRFTGHPDLRRILMYEEFKGHPLRKDYPVQGKQPRIPLRAPEVENTARKMLRSDLVTIRARSNQGDDLRTGDQDRGDRDRGGQDHSPARRGA